MAIILLGILIAARVDSIDAVTTPYVPRTSLFLQQAYVPYGAEERCWYTLVMRESDWESEAQNPNSTAYGLGQFLDSTWAGTGYEKTSDPKIQLAAMKVYVANRYGTFCAALRFQIENDSY